MNSFLIFRTQSFHTRLCISPLTTDYFITFVSISFRSRYEYQERHGKGAEKTRCVQQNDALQISEWWLNLMPLISLTGLMAMAGLRVLTKVSYDDALYEGLLSPKTLFQTLDTGFPIIINTIAVMEYQDCQSFHLSETRYVVLSSDSVSLSNLRYPSVELIVYSKATHLSTETSPLQPFSDSHQDQILQSRQSGSIQKLMNTRAMTTFFI